jgi:hypothetical protein
MPLAEAGADVVWLAVERNIDYLPWWLWFWRQGRGTLWLKFKGAVGGRPCCVDVKATGMQTRPM